MAIADSLRGSERRVSRNFFVVIVFGGTPLHDGTSEGVALGAEAGERRLLKVALEGGFTRFRRVTETPFNLVLEARP